MLRLSNHNEKAWDRKVAEGSPYTKVVSRDKIEKARKGNWEITVTTEKAVPRNWFPASIEGLKILCLAAGGGQQAPILAAAGADVTVMDISKKQLEQDEEVARRDCLNLKVVQGDMTNLSHFKKESFDIVVHPVSNLFIENPSPVWGEIARVLKQQGILIAGFTNPLLWIFDDEQEKKGILDVKHPIPSSTLDHLEGEVLEDFLKREKTIEFAHTLEDQIQGQIDAGFAVTGFYEDDFGGKRMLDKYIKTFIATRAVKIAHMGILPK